MPDPFEALRLPPAPLAPDLGFAARLRSRVERALTLPKGVIVSDATLAGEPAAAAALRHGDIAYVSLSVPDVARAASFFSEVLGWHYAPSGDPQRLQVEDLTLHHGLTATDVRPTLFLCFAVEDVAAAAESVRAAGGSAGEPHLEPYGLISDCVDDQGVSFAVFEPPGGLGGPGGGASGPANGARPGDLAYVTMEVVDSSLARAFYGSVLGWRFAGGRVDDGWQVEDVVPMVGLAGGHANATTVPMYRVDDVGAAVRRARAAGGAATDPERQPYGVTSACSDDQGTRFYLGEL